MDITDFTADLSEQQRNVMQVLDAEILRLPDIELKKRYHLPFYYGLSWMCYINPLKAGGVELCFTRGVHLSNANGLLESRGRKLILGVTISSPGEIDLIRLRETLYDAYLLDRQWKKGSRKV